MADLIGRIFWLPSLLVGQPVWILGIATLFAVVAILGRGFEWGQERRLALLWIAAGGWALYAFWEGLLRITSPHDTIRIDLLLIWPVLFFGTLIVLIRAFRRVDPYRATSSASGARRERRGERTPPSPGTG